MVQSMDKAKDLIKKANMELKKGNWDVASEVFGEAVQILESASTNEGKVLLAEALRKKGHADSRRAEFDTAVDQLKRAQGAFEVVNREKEAKEVRELLKKMA